MTAPYTTKTDARYIPVKATATVQWSASNTTLASAAYTSKDVTVAAATAGDVVDIGSPQDNAGMLMSAWVKTAGTVTIGVYNATTATQTIGTGTLKLVIVDSSVGT